MFMLCEKFSRFKYIRNLYFITLICLPYEEVGESKMISSQQQGLFSSLIERDRFSMLFHLTININWSIYTTIQSYWCVSLLS